MGDVSLPVCRDKRRSVIRNDNDFPEFKRIKISEFVPAVHAGALSIPRHKDGEVGTINENLSVTKEFTAVDAPT